MTDVVNDGYRKPPGDAERRAAPSDELVSDEELRTDRDSSIAVKFVDGSELSVEAQSEVVLSDYLFDPTAAASTGVINLNAGLFHFNSNDIPDGGLVLKTPVATIGIRGTEFLVTVKNDTTIVDILDGKVEVTPLDGGAAATCEGGQSILVKSAKSDAMCGDLGAFSTAAGEPPPAAHQSGGNGRDGGAQAGAKASGKSGGGSSGGSTGGGDPGGDPGGGDPGNGGEHGEGGDHDHHGEGGDHDHHGEGGDHDHHHGGGGEHGGHGGEGGDH